MYRSRDSLTENFRWFEKNIKGSFSRSSVNAQSGVATPAGGVYVGGLVIMALAFLTPAFVFIPSATLVLNDI